MKYTVNSQIYRQLRDDIVAGRLKDGAKLPSKRFAAAELGVSVITVEHAYELLEEEGYIQSRQRSGYYVCFGGSAPALPRTAPQEQRQLPDCTGSGFFAPHSGQNLPVAVAPQAHFHVLPDGACWGCCAPI